MASRDIYEQTFDEYVQQTDQNTCPECSGRVTSNTHETVCDDCGLVIEDEQFDHGPESRELRPIDSNTHRSDDGSLLRTGHLLKVNATAAPFLSV